MSAPEDFLVARADEIPVGGKKIVEVGGRSVGVYNTTEGYFAIHNVCPHNLAPLCAGELGGTALPSAPGTFRYGMEGFVLRCPWHQWEFDIRTGETVCATDRRKALTFPVRIENGNVLVTVKRPRRARLPQTA